MENLSSGHMREKSGRHDQQASSRRVGAAGEERRGGWKPFPAPMGDGARHAALRALARQARIAPELDPRALEAILEREVEAGEPTTALSPRDEAFARAIYDAGVRRWLTLRFLLERQVRRRWEDLHPRVRAALIGGAAQFLFLDRVPSHAAIDHAVEWAKAGVHAGAGGLVNAALRGLLRAIGDPSAAADGGLGRGDAFAAEFRERFEFGPEELPLIPARATGGGWARSLILPRGVLPEDEVDRLAVTTSHPAGLLRRWAARYGIGECKRLALHSLSEPPVVLNVMHARGPLPEGMTRAHTLPGSAVYCGPAGGLGAFLAERPDIWVQDAASAGVLAGVGGVPREMLEGGPGGRPRLIADLCAGQGTKTRQLAAMFPESEIVATDVDEQRLGVLARTFAGDPRVRVEGWTRAREGALGRADLVVLDVPCSNTGVIARRPESRYRLSVAALESLGEIQRQVIADAIPLLSDRPRGRVVYATCSLEPEENGGMAKWAGRWHRFEVLREAEARPAGGGWEDAATYRDGGYSVLLG